MKFLPALLIASSLAATSGAHAAAVSQFSIILDWSTLSTSGVTMAPTSFPLPGGGPTVSSEAEGWVGSSSGGDLDEALGFNGAAAIASYTDTSLNLQGGYDGGDDVGASAEATNAGPGRKDGWGGGWREFFYTAESTGSVRFSIDYTVLANVSTAEPGFGGFEFATGGYWVLMEATDADAYSAAYTDAKNNGATDEEADEAGFAAGDLEFFEFRDDDLLTCINECVDSTSLQRDMSLTFDVEAGTTYAFGAEGGVYASTDVNAVPLPAAAWLFGSGLIGLLGMARKQRKLRQS